MAKRRVKKVKEVTPWITAWAERTADNYFLVKVPVNTDGIIPRVPDAIKVDKEYFVLCELKPVTYKLVIIPKKFVSVKRMPEIRGRYGTTWY